jgi:hypothetical protein
VLVCAVFDRQQRGGIYLNQWSLFVPQVVSDPSDTLTRYGRDPETAEELARQAAAAESAIGIHGVSTRLNTARRGKKALLADVESAFPGTRQSGNDPQHFTVVLPKPVTQEIADQFNELFPPQR